MRKTLTTFLVLILILQAFAQNNKPATEIKRPKLVVGVIVDQMRWDYIYRFYNLYKENGGFKRILNTGFTCENTMVPYLPTVTACGHACVYTGSVPAIHGITGNNWFDNYTQKNVYCVKDKSVTTVGSNAVEDGQMSPANLFTTTITDELKLATNQRSKVIGMSMKDRGAILPAGHSANAAYWYDGKSGNFITSSYYMAALPNWVTAFNNKKLVDSLYASNWTLSFPRSIYTQYCDIDSNGYEAKPFGSKQQTLPYTLQSYIGTDYSKIAVTPYANNLLASFAKNAIANEGLGKNSVTDFLTISFSSPDYVGHSFGPNSWEMLDTYIKLDETLGKLLDYLDKSVGKEQYTFFLTADHAGAHIPEYLKKNKIPADRWDDAEIKSTLNEYLLNTYKVNSLINAVWEYDVYFNHPLIDSLKLDLGGIKQKSIAFLNRDPKVLTTIDKPNAALATIPSAVKEMIVNGYNTQRSGDLQIIMKPGVMDAGKTGMSHGVWNPYDAHIPLLWYGWGIKKGNLKKTIYMTDIAPTIANLLHIQMPNGCVGKTIEEVIK